MVIKIGIIGITGRVGKLLCEEIDQNSNFIRGKAFSREGNSLEEVFADNDCVIDFSSPDLLKDILIAAINNPKPLIICTTGWDYNNYQKEIKEISAKVPLLIAPNTSLGACVQLFITKQLAKILGTDFDIDIIEKHHRNKIDIPSGTSRQLANSIIEVKGHDYTVGEIKHGPRPDNFIGSVALRSGSVFGEHEVIFTGDCEMVSIKHQAFNRSLFAKGALEAAKWCFFKKTPGLYNMLDVVC